MNWQIKHAGTGRTYRMLVAAVEEAKKGKGIALLFATPAQAKTAMRDVLRMWKVEASQIEHGDAQKFSVMIRIDGSGSICGVIEFRSPANGNSSFEHTLLQGLAGRPVIGFDKRFPYAVDIDHFVLEYQYGNILTAWHKYLAEPAGPNPNL